MIEGDAKKALLKLFQCFNVSGSGEERKIKFEAYWEALSDLPFDTIVIVCRKASRGEVGNYGFLPTAAELYQAAVDRVPKTAYPKLGDRKYFSPEERIQVNDGFRSLHAELRENTSRQLAVAGFVTLGAVADKPLTKWKSYELAQNYAPVVSREELRGMDRIDREANRIEAESHVAKYRDKPLPKLSDELRKKLGACIPEIKE